MEERSRNSYYVAELECKVCHLHWSRAGVARVFIDWNQQPVLLLATRLLANRDAKSFQYEKGAAYDRQQIQMGLRKGNTVLIHYRRGSDLYQSVLIMQDADLKQGKLAQNSINTGAMLPLSGPTLTGCLRKLQTPLQYCLRGFRREAVWRA